MRSAKGAPTDEAIVSAAENAVQNQDTDRDLPNEWAAANGLVFLGFRVEWHPQLSDWEMNQRQGERWEREFTKWEITNRELTLSVAQAGYYVRLSDGVADFRCESEAAYLMALSHAGELVARLVRERHTGATTAMELQFLVPVETGFEALVGVLDKRLLKPDILATVNARLFDAAYLVDTRIGGTFYQFNIGPLRAREIRGRVTARHLKSYPEVSLFVSISTRKPFQYEASDLASYVRNTINIGNTITKEIFS